MDSNKLGHVVWTICDGLHCVSCFGMKRTVTFKLSGSFCSPRGFLWAPNYGPNYGALCCFEGLGVDTRGP